MSSSPPASSAPIDDAILENAFRKAVQDVYQSGDLEQLTVRRIRKVVEGELGLQEDFFKDDTRWKDRSKNVISAAVAEHDEDNASSQPKPPPAPSPLTTTKPPKTSVKRSSMEEQAPRKRRKTESDEDHSISADENGHMNTAKATIEEPSETAARPDPQPTLAQDSDSDLSSLIDEPPKPKGRRKKSDSAKPAKTSSKTGSKTNKKASEPSPADPDQEEIKRLQGWLVKCGIRKMWFRELAQCNTSKDKIRHLKKMLSDAGMTGRYSQEKANQIREERELKADLEAVQEGDKHWGKNASEPEEGDSGARPKRRLAKGLQELDFLNDDDGEETD